MCNHIVYASTFVQKTHTRKLFCYHYHALVFGKNQMKFNGLSVLKCHLILQEQLLFWTYISQNNCHLHPMWFGLYVLRTICHFEHLSFKHVILNTCHLNMSFWTHVIWNIWNICHLEHMSFGTYVISNHCHSDDMSLGTNAAKIKFVQKKCCAT